VTRTPVTIVEELQAVADKLRSVAAPLSSPQRTEAYWNGWHNGLGCAATMLEKRAARLAKQAKKASKKR
jgi:hypothetical protein